MPLPDVVLHALICPRLYIYIIYAFAGVRWTQTTDNRNNSYFVLTIVLFCKLKKAIKPRETLSLDTPSQFLRRTRSLTAVIGFYEDLFYLKAPSWKHRAEECRFVSPRHGSFHGVSATTALITNSPQGQSPASLSSLAKRDLFFLGGKAREEKKLQGSCIYPNTVKAFPLEENQ